MSDFLYIGIDLGGTNVKTVLLNDSHEVLEKHCFQTDDSQTEPEQWKQKIATHIEDLKQKSPAATFRCGIAAPGLADAENLSISYMPGRLHGLENLSWKSILNMPVYVLNDAHAACIGEWKKGAAAGYQHVLMITLGTGVGGAAILQGKLCQGALGRAGHFGHITVDYAGRTSSTNMVGSLENAIGNLSVSERTHGHFHDTADLVNAYRHGDVKAVHWWLTSVNKLACALSSLVNAFSPEIIVVGGGIANANDALFKPLTEFMTLYEWRPGNFSTPIRKAALGEYAGAIGAAVFPASKV